MKIQVIIVAGGKGKRMKTEIPKQFLLLKGKPILMHTIELFLPFSKNIFLVLPKQEIEQWNALTQKYNFEIPLTIVEGGTERFFSVQNALNQCSEEGIVLIHDGVRPLVSKKTIQNVIDKAIENNAAIPVVDIEESLRLLARKESMAVDRNKYKLVQTPQAFNTKLIKESYQQEYIPQFTDDASVFEAAGFSVFLVQGNKENIKITTPKDLYLSEFLQKSEF